MSWTTAASITVVRLSRRAFPPATRTPLPAAATLLPHAVFGKSSSSANTAWHYAPTSPSTRKPPCAGTGA
ncbi:hypothetical protein [Streptomyces avermitilis]|uniref:hypothetical protein n=1 Tax=Streptomyces avermitilis TaxID=33903 RepID=UPI00382C8131